MPELTILAPLNATENTLYGVFYLPLNAPFSQSVQAFIQCFSQQLLKNENCKAHPELVALGFWLRQSNIAKMQTANTHSEKFIQKPLGTVLHFTPSNVDSMFVYSWICALLMGNNNIIRVASADSPAKLCLIEQLQQLFAQEEFQQIAERNVFVSYPRESALTAKLSLIANARVLWGGDESVQAIRAIPSHPRCRDISFADRYSACLINGDALQNAAQITELATKLWRDTEPHAQQACSSPKLIYWLGDTSKQSELFSQINQLALNKSQAPNQLNNHLVTSQLIQSTGSGKQIIIQNSICALAIERFDERFLDWHQGAGLFLVLTANNVEELESSITDKLQTLSYWQVDKDELFKLGNNTSIKGIDRIAPVGQALDFSSTWDGYDLFSQLSTRLEIS